MKRLMENTVFSGFVTAWRLATCPTSRSPDFVNATTDGVRRPPSGLVMTTDSPPSMTATTELVVPRSIPMILLMTPAPLLAQRENLSPMHYKKMSAVMSIEASSGALWDGKTGVIEACTVIFVEPPCLTARGDI